jgi:hypothetical protein
LDNGFLGCRLIDGYQSLDLLPALLSPTSKLKTEAASSCEKFVTAHETTRCHKSEESNLNFQHHENLSSQMKKMFK